MRPDFWLKFESDDITNLIRGSVLSISVDDKNGIESDTATLTLDDRLQKIEPPRTGVKIDIGLGYAETGIKSMGLFVVDEVRIRGMPNQIEISAKGADFVENLKEQKTKSYDDKTLKEILEEKAKELGLELSIGDDLAQKKVAHIDQTNESTMHFITRLGNMYDAVAKPVNGKLAFHKHGEAKNSSGQTPEAITINITDCLSWDATIADYTRVSAVKARYYDKDKAQYVEKKSGEGPVTKTLKETHASEQEAQDAADSASASQNRATGEVSLRVIGNPELRAEKYIILQGFHRAIDKKWLMTEVRHELSSSGYTTSITCSSESATGDKKGSTTGPASGRKTPSTMSLEELQRQASIESQSIKDRNQPATPGGAAAPPGNTGS